jgi:hypothetical protein
VIQASCHCGGVQLSVEHAPTEVTDCNCSICRRYGALWAYYQKGQVQIVGRTETYAWGERRLAFHRCAVCGSVTHWAPVDETNPRVGVNARMMDPQDLSGARVRRLDGADTWTYLDEAPGQA